ncbi:hypothetical protein FRC01_009746, partial [Tulasnella sp. 417]
MDPPMQYQHPSSSHYPPAHPQLSDTPQIFQYPAQNQPTTANSAQSLVQPLDAALPTEYDLVSQTPEERAVLLEVLRERRRVRELELRILEERRREREAVGRAVGSNAGSTNSPPSAGSAGAIPEWNPVPDIDRVAFSALGVTRHPQTNPASQPATGAGPPPGRYPTQLPPLSTTQHHRQQHLYPPRSANSADDTTFMNYEHQPPASARPLTGVSSASSASSSFANVFDSLPPGLGLSADQTDARSPHHHDNLQSRDALGAQETYGTTGHYAEPRDSVIQGSARPASQHDTPFEHGLYGHGTSLPPMTGNWGSPSDHHPTSGTAVSIGGSPQGHGLGSSSSSSIFNSLPNQQTVPSMAPIVRSSPSNFTGDVSSHLYDEPHRLGQAPLGYPMPRSRNSSHDEGASPPSHLYSTPSPNHHLHAQAHSPYDDQFHPSMQVKHPRFESGPSAAGPSYAPPTGLHPSMGHSHTPPSGIPHMNPTQPAFSVLPAPPSVAGPSSMSASAAAAGKKPKKLLFERQIACQHCHQQICKLLLRGTAEELGVTYDPVYECMACVPPTTQNNAATASSSASAATSLGSVGAGGGYGSGTGGFQGSGIRITRKRTRQTEDTANPT